MPALLFVDTSGWYAAFARSERSHASVVHTLREARAQRARIVTSTDVLDEILTLARMRASHALAVRIGEALWRKGGAEVLEVDSAAREAAFRLFARYSDHTLSFTDCTSAALMRQRGIEHVVSLDRHFDVLGFVRLPRDA